jgi:hypothetical protein
LGGLEVSLEIPFRVEAIDPASPVPCLAAPAAASLKTETAH